MPTSATAKMTISIPKDRLGTINPILQSIQNEGHNISQTLLDGLQSWEVKKRITEAIEDIIPDDLEAMEKKEYSRLQRAKQQAKEAPNGYCTKCSAPLLSDEDSDNCSNCKKLRIQEAELGQKHEAMLEQRRQEAAAKEEKSKVIKQLKDIWDYEIGHGADEERRAKAAKLYFAVTYGNTPIDNPEVKAILDTKGSNPAEALPTVCYSQQQGEEPLESSKVVSK